MELRAISLTDVQRDAYLECMCVCQGETTHDRTCFDVTLSLFVYLTYDSTCMCLNTRQGI